MQSRRTRTTGVALQRKPIERFVLPDIYTVIWNNDVTTLRVILRMAPEKDLMKPCKEGFVHLHNAAYYGFLECLKVLVRTFPQHINIRTPQGETPLFIAVSRQHLACVECLLGAGVNPNIPNKDGETCLYIACEKNYERIAELLIQCGANVCLENNEGLTPLHDAARNRNLTLCKQLVYSGAYLWARSRHGIEPLFTAAQGGCPEVVKFLIKHGANINAHANDGATALFEAARNGHAEVVNLLLSMRADADIGTFAGLTPLHIASKHGHARVVALLIPHTDLISMNQCGISPLHLAAEEEEDEILEMLIHPKLDVNTLLSKEYSERYEDKRRTALYFTVCGNNYEGTSMLLAGGANPNLDMFSPLLVAVRNGERDMVDLLLEYGANVNACIPTQPTTFPAALLFCMNNMSMLKLLLNNGCDARACFICFYGDSPHPQIKTRHIGNNLHVHDFDTQTRTAQFCEILADPYHAPWAGPVIDLLLDYVGPVKLCSKLMELLDSNNDWAYIKEKAKPPFSLMHLCRLRIHELVGPQRVRKMTSLPLPRRLIKYLFYDKTESEQFLYHGSY